MANPPPVNIVASQQSTEMTYVLQAAAGATGTKQAFPATDDDSGNAHILALQPLVCAAVSDASYVAANAQSTQAIVYWSSSNSVIILRKTAAWAGEAPANGTGYAAGNAIGAATVVYDGAAGVAGVTCTGTSCTNTGLTNGTTYYYKVFAKTGSGASSCYAPGTVNTSAGVTARPASGAGAPAWSYMLAGGSMLRGGTAGSATLYATSNASRIVSVNTADGTQSWVPAATNAPIQAWLTWLPVGSGGIKSVQTGTRTMAATSETLGAAQGFAGVTDLTRSFVVCTQQASSSNASFRVACDLSSPTTLTLTAGATGPVVQWSVAEFKGGVSVQRNTASFATTDTTLNVPLTSVDLTKSFVLISQWTSSASQITDEQWTTRARLTSSTNLELSRNASGTDLTVAWQVVQMSAASVQRGAVCIGAAGTCPGSNGSTNTATLATPVDTSKSFIVMSRKGGSLVGGIEAEYQVRADFSSYGASINGLTFSRTTTVTTANHQVDIAWEVVSLSDGSTVRRGSSSTGATTDTTISPTLSPSVVTSQSVPFISVSGGGGTATDNLDETSWTAAVSSSALALTRAGTGTNATIAWQVVQFATNGGGPAVFGVDQGTGSPDQARLYSVDPGTGTTNWQIALTGADQFQAAVSAQVRSWSSAGFQAAYPTDDVLFATTLNTLGTFNTNNRVFARSASDGALLWTFSGTMDGIAGMPYVDYARDRLYVASRAGSAGNQQSLWVIKTVDGEGVLKGQAMVCPACTASGRHFATSPTLSYDGNTLYIGDTAGNLRAINAGALTLKWTLALGTAVNGFVWEDVGISGRLYFTTADGNVRCYQDNGGSASACSGWTVNNVTGAATPLVLGKLFVGSWDPAAAVGQKGKLYQINLTTGAVDKSVVVGDGEKQVGEASSETGNEVFVGTTEGKIFKFPLTGGSL